MSGSKLINGVSIGIVFLLFFISCDLQEPSVPVVPPEQFQQAGLEGMTVNSFITDGSVIYATTDNGVWSASTADDIPEWTSEGLNGQNVVDMVLLPDGSMLAGVETEQNQSEQPTIYRLDTFSEDWEPYQQNYGGEQNYNNIHELELHPEQPDLIFARGDYHTAKSTSAGDSWEIVFSDWDAIGYQSDLLEIDPHNSDRIWIGGESSSLQPYLYYSVNLGQSWEELELETGGDDAVYSMAFHPDDENQILLGLEGKILHSTDRGQSWSTAFENELYHYIHAMVHPNDELSETVYASGTEQGTQGGNLYFLVTDDFGENWEKISAEQQFQNIGTHDLYVQEIGNEKKIYLATSEGVWIYRE